MKEKGQALVEFVLILPVVILILLCLIDISSIYLKKYDLNNSLEVISDFYQNNEEDELKAYVAREDLGFSLDEDGSLVKITVWKNMDINAPILSNVLGKNYRVTAQKKVYHE